MIRNFLIDTGGATAIEYGALAAVLGIGIIAAAQIFAPRIAAAYDRLGEALLAPQAAASCNPAVTLCVKLASALAGAGQ